MALTRLNTYTPVSPFVYYWVIAYLLFNFGPFITPSVTLLTHIFVIFFYILFLLFFKAGTGRLPKRVVEIPAQDADLAKKIVFYSCALFFLGQVLFVYDRISSGAGNLDLVQNELYDIREIYAKRITILTTLAVIPQSFRLVAISGFMYCSLKKIRLSRSVNILFALAIFSEVVNMVISANRGSLYWYFLYAYFYFSFGKGNSLTSEIFSTKNLGVKLISLVGFSLAISYFLWVAENRVLNDTAEYLGKVAYAQLKYKESVDVLSYQTIGAIHHIFIYLTSGFEYVDAIINRGDIFNFDLLSATGIRVEYQISRFIPGYIHPGRESMLASINQAGLIESGWPSIFGASIGFFGVIGALGFSSVLGYICGVGVRKWVFRQNLPSFIFVFLTFSSLSLSFDWPVRDFDQYVALIICLYFYTRSSENRRPAVVYWNHI